MIYKNPNDAGSVVSFKSRYENYIGGEWIAPTKGTYHYTGPARHPTSSCLKTGAFFPDPRHSIKVARPLRDWERHN